MGYLLGSGAITAVWIMAGLFFFGPVAIVSSYGVSVSSLFGTMFGFWILGCIIGVAVTLLLAWDSVSGF